MGFGSPGRRAGYILNRFPSLWSSYQVLMGGTRILFNRQDAKDAKFSYIFAFFPGTDVPRQVCALAVRLSAIISVINNKDIK